MVLDRQKPKLQLVSLKKIYEQYFIRLLQPLLR